MTKQEEVREGIARFIAEQLGEDWGMLPDIATRKHYLIVDKEQYRRKADRLIIFLHDEGVAIKVDRELPDTFSSTYEEAESKRATQQDMLKAGYSAWKPLIEGVK